MTDKQKKLGIGAALVGAVLYFGQAPKPVVPDNGCPDGKCPVPRQPDQPLRPIKPKPLPNTPGPDPFRPSPTPDPLRP